MELLVNRDARERRQTEKIGGVPVRWLPLQSPQHVHAAHLPGPTMILLNCSLLFVYVSKYTKILILTYIFLELYRRASLLEPLLD